MARLLPQYICRSTTVVLRKPGKDNYTAHHSYRPIALLSTLGKVLKAIIAARISYLEQAEHLLPDNHIGGRKGQT